MKKIKKTIKLLLGWFTFILIVLNYQYIIKNISIFDTSSVIVIASTWFLTMITGQNVKIKRKVKELYDFLSISNLIFIDIIILLWMLCGNLSLKDLINGKNEK